MKFPRNELKATIEEALTANPIVVLQGPRQCGKTTLARSLGVSDSHYFDLDDPLDTIRLEENARTTLGNLKGLVIIDEAQQKPDLFSLLRVLADRTPTETRFLLLGSSSLLLLQQISESLAGRAHFIDMGGFSLSEVGYSEWRTLWEKGSFPRAFQLASLQSHKWRLDYVRQFVNRDLRQLAESKMSDSQVRRLIQYIAASNGSAWNSSQAASNIGVNYKTIQRHIEIFRSAFLIRELQVFNNNAHKRLRKSPTIYLRDSGLVHALLQIYDLNQLLANPALGASWEGFALGQVISVLRLEEEQCYTWSLQSGAEIDLVFQSRGFLYGVEFKHSDAPRTTRSFTQACEELNLKSAAIIHTGPKTWELAPNRHAVSIDDLAALGEIMNV